MPATQSPNATMRESLRRQGAGSAHVLRRADVAEKPRASIATAIRPARRKLATSNPKVRAPV